MKIVIQNRISASAYWNKDKGRVSLIISEFEDDCDNDNVTILEMSDNSAMEIYNNLSLLFESEGKHGKDACERSENN